MKPLCWLLVPLLVVLLVLPVLAVEPEEGGEADPDTSVSETIDDGITEEPSEPDGPGILDYVISINSYLTYLFGFTVVGFCWWALSLVYKFLNMFF